MAHAGAMAPSDTPRSPSRQLRWQGSRIGITGARGALGQALIRRLRARGAHVVGLSHRDPPQADLIAAPDRVGPQEWVRWDCGQEDALLPLLHDLDVLVLNHGLNPGADQSTTALNRALEVNALSSWRLLERFERIAASDAKGRTRRELWVNTSEAEIQPALSPAYELSKRLLGQLVSLRWSERRRQPLPNLILRKLVLGPFRSELNPIGVMSADWVAGQIIMQCDWGLRLVIVTPNPFTYLLMPLSELGRAAYNRWISNPPDR